MKRSNQTISLRDLVKKMKRHSTRTIFVTAILMAILCGGLIYAFFPAQDVKAQEKEAVNVQQPQSEMQQQLDSIMTYLQEIDRKAEGNAKTLTQMQKDVEADRSEEKNVISEKEENIIKSIGEMKKSMEALHDQIVLAGKGIAELQNQLNQNTLQSQQDMDQRFSKITESLEQISLNYAQTQSQVELLLKNISDQEKEHYRGMVDKLTDIQTDMKSADLKNLTDMTQQLKEIETVYLKEIKNLQLHVDDSITGMDTHISEQFSTMNATVVEQYQAIQQQFGSDNKELMQILTDTGKDITDKFNQVFRLVSDGKKLLASALLTKGVNITADARFSDYAQAITKIPQQLLIGVDKLPGTIHYDYHHHVCADGSEPGTEQEEEMGGCYTNPVYHVHTGNMQEEGGCYTIPVYHSHSGSCYTTYSYSAVTDTIIGEAGEENGHSRHIYYCSQCDGTFSGTNGWHIHNERVMICGKNANQIERYAVSCNMTQQTVIGYCPGCGLHEGQIVAAHIIYEDAAEKNFEPAMVEVPEMDYPESDILPESKTVIIKNVLNEEISFGGNLQSETVTQAEQKNAESQVDKAEDGAGDNKSVEDDPEAADEDIQTTQTENTETELKKPKYESMAENNSAAETSLEKFQ